MIIVARVVIPFELMHDHIQSAIPNIFFTEIHREEHREHRVQDLKNNLCVPLCSSLCISVKKNLRTVEQLKLECDQI